MISSRDLLQKIIPTSLPPPNTFKGQVVLVTGATSGLGLAAAVHFVNLGASEVIITGRNISRGEAAKSKIEAVTAQKGRGKVRVMVLDMNRYSSIVSFVDKLKDIRTGRGGLDYALLNAGVGAVTFKLSPEGMEEDLQVNGVSTTLLGLLLLSIMKPDRNNRDVPAHLGFVNSGQAANCDIKDWSSWKHEGILTHMSQVQNWAGNNDTYNNSKLVSLYGINELSKLAIGANGRPDVIVNPICPGIVKTNITRDAGAIAAVFMSVLGKSPEYGARALVKGGLTTEAENGKFINFYSNETEFLSKFDRVLFSRMGKETQSIIWNETVDAVSPRVPEIGSILAFQSFKVL